MPIVLQPPVTTDTIAPARAVLRLLGHPAADTLHPDDVFAETLVAIDFAIDAESPDEYASTMYYRTGDPAWIDAIDAFESLHTTPTISRGIAS